MREMLTERDVKEEIKKLLKAHNWTFWMPPMNGYGQTGVSDFCCLRQGVFLAIEAKFGKPKMRPMQVKFLNEVMLEQGFAFVVNEATLPALASFLIAFDKAVEQTAGGTRPDVDTGAEMLETIRIMTEPYAAA